MKIYVLTAYRNGNCEEHSYTVGAHTDFNEAKETAEEHCDYRGGKYSVVVEEFRMNQIDHDEGGKEVYRAKGRLDSDEYRKAYAKRKLGLK